jgi:hypothetical protein
MGDEPVHRIIGVDDQLVAARALARDRVDDRVGDLLIRRVRERGLRQPVVAVVVVGRLVRLRVLDPGLFAVRGVGERGVGLFVRGADAAAREITDSLRKGLRGLDAMMTDAEKRK